MKRKIVSWQDKPFSKVVDFDNWFLEFRTEGKPLITTITTTYILQRAPDLDCKIITEVKIPIKNINVTNIEFIRLYRKAFEYTELRLIAKLKKRGMNIPMEKISDIWILKQIQGGMLSFN